MNNLIPQWLDLQSAVAYLTNKTKEEWAIPSLLELGRIGKVPMYAVMQEGTYIQYWETKDNQATLRQKEIADLLLITPQQIEQILKMYPAHGYELLIEAPLPNGCSYDLPEYMPILMRMESKGFSRGVVIKSHEAIRILGKELEGYLQSKPATPAPEVIKSDIDKPWLVHNPLDPQPDYSWYTPARYFARKTLKEKPLLINNKKKLAGEVATLLFKIKDYPRGRVSERNPLTVLKAFTNCTLT